MLAAMCSVEVVLYRQHFLYEKSQASLLFGAGENGNI